MSKQNTEKDLVLGLVKGLAIIACFNSERPRLSSSEAAKLVGITRAAARRSLLTLCTMGYADFDGKYFELRPKVLELGFSYLSSLRLPDLVRPAIEDLAIATGETASAAFLDGDSVIAAPQSPARRITQMRIST